MPKINDLPSDGILKFGRYKTARDESGKKIGERFDTLGELFFSYVNIRQSDTEFYKTYGKTVDLKVKTYYVKGIERQSLKVLVDGVFYEVTEIDPDFNREFMFWYLTKVGMADGF